MDMEDDRWVVAAETETHSDVGHVGVRVSVLLPRKLTKNEMVLMGLLAYQAQEAVLEESCRRDPERREAMKKERLDIIDLFPTPIYVREIPNGYCSQWCCKDRPWFAVVTTVGLIIVGWRKRVLVIDWTGSDINKTADELFPDQDTTMEGMSIHAWNYDKAREYIATLMNQEIKIAE